MKAIYNNRLYDIVDDDGEGLYLEELYPYDTNPRTRFVHYGDRALVVDPTDGEIANL